METPIEELRSLLEMAEAELLPEGNTLHGLLVPVELVREIIAQPVATDTNVGDTISRQAAIDALQNCRKHCIDPFDSYHIDIQDAENQLSKVPTIQPEPKEGEWIRTDCGLDVECKCSVCGYRDFVSPHDTYWFNRNFCPNCGAKMKGKRQK